MAADAEKVANTANSEQNNNEAKNEKTGPKREKQAPPPPKREKDDTTHPYLAQLAKLEEEENKPGKTYDDILLVEEEQKLESILKEALLMSEAHGKSPNSLWSPNARDDESIQSVQSSQLDSFGRGSDLVGRGSRNNSNSVGTDSAPSVPSSDDESTYISETNHANAAKTSKSRSLLDGLPEGIVEETGSDVPSAKTVNAIVESEGTGEEFSS